MSAMETIKKRQHSREGKPNRNDCGRNGRKSLSKRNQVYFHVHCVKRNEDWEELSKKLNTVGGAIKNVKCWQK
ncbi:hypothetical protein AVEN_49859-1, partial [Araneus ventricosus]